ncbi:uncharacterized protein G2W53_013766 [Senna tora]|uniref:Uncharacterized protein n=1 Tax=Senna tora TaxID=362788 RepID=A0A834TZ78_9FABA|nr:uncharacterized protein G2W53_013766 [Senna tora]
MGVEALERERRDGFGEGLVRLTAWRGMGEERDGVLGYGEEEEREVREREGRLKRRKRGKKN